MIISETKSPEYRKSEINQSKFHLLSRSFDENNVVE
jgi:hypothetical protein